LVTGLVSIGFELEASPSPEVIIVNSLHDPTPYEFDLDVEDTEEIMTFREAVEMVNENPNISYNIKFATNLNGTIVLRSNLLILNANVKINGSKRIRLERESNCIEFIIDGGAENNEPLTKEVILNGLRIQLALTTKNLAKIQLNDCIVGPKQGIWNFEDIHLLNASNNLGELVRGPIDSQGSNYQKEKEKYKGTDQVLKLNVGDIIIDDDPPAPCAASLNVFRFWRVENVDYVNINRSIITDESGIQNESGNGNFGVNFNPNLNGVFSNSILYLSSYGEGGGIPNYFFNSWEIEGSFLDFSGHTFQPCDGPNLKISNSKFPFYSKGLDNFESERKFWNTIGENNLGLFKNNQSKLVLFEGETEIWAEGTYFSFFNPKEINEILHYENKLYLNDPSFKLGDKYSIEVYSSSRYGEYLSKLFDIDVTVESNEIDGELTEGIKIPLVGYYNDYVRLIIYKDEEGEENFFETQPYSLPYCNTPSDQTSLISPDLDFYQSWRPSDNLTYSSQIGLEEFPVLGNGADKYSIEVKLAPVHYENGAKLPDFENAISQFFDYDFPPLLSNTLTTENGVLKNSNLEGQYFVYVGLHYGEPDFSFVYSDPVLVNVANEGQLDSEVPLNEYFTSFSSVHEGKINWEYTVNYFDNGETSETMLFSDGLGQERQNQVLNSSENEILTTETAYGLEGASKISSLPAPTMENHFQFKEDFFDIIDDGGVSRDFRTFYVDRLQEDNNSFIIPPPISSVDHGSVGQFYSETGPEEIVGSAGGYPYVYALSESFPDGRILRQSSGTGVEHLASDEHGIKTFYLEPSQSELDRLFGGEAPLASSVSKEITYDPNNVGNISYKDFFGNVLATGVAGINAIGSLIPFQPKNPDTDVDDGENGLLDFTINLDLIQDGQEELDLENLKKRIVKNVHIVENVDFTLDYSLEPKHFELQFEELNFCDNCNYEVKVKVTQKSNNAVVFEESQTLNPTTDLCQGGVETPLHLSVELELSGPDDYIIERTIQLVGADGLPNLSSLWEEVNENLTFDDSYDTFLQNEFGYEGFFVLRSQRSIKDWEPTDDDIAFPIFSYNAELLVGGGTNSTGYGSELLLEKARKVVIGNYIPFSSDAQTPLGTMYQNRMFILAEDKIYSSHGENQDTYELLVQDPNLIYGEDLFLNESSGELMVKLLSQNQDVPIFLSVDSWSGNIEYPDNWSPPPFSIGNRTGLSYHNGLLFDCKPDNFAIGITNQPINGLFQNWLGLFGNKLTNEPGIQRNDKRLANPVDIACNETGNEFFIADNESFTIRKVIYHGEVGSSEYSMDMIAGQPFNNSGISTGVNDEIILDEMRAIEVLGNRVVVTFANTNDLMILEPLPDGSGNYSSEILSLNNFDNIFNGASLCNGLEYRSGELYICYEGENAGIFKISSSIDVTETGNGCPNSENCHEIISYLDECELLDANGLKLNTATFDAARKISGLDGDVGTSIGEIYISNVSSIYLHWSYPDGLPEGNLKDRVVESYLRQYGIDVSSKINEAYIYKINAGQSYLPILRDNLTLEEDQDIFILFYLKFAPPTCLENCEINIFGENETNAEDYCSELKLMRRAEFVSAINELKKSTNNYVVNGESVSLFEYINLYYPLSFQQYSILENEFSDAGDVNNDGAYDFDLYQNYLQSYLAFEAFSLENCISVNNSSEDQTCSNCAETYKYEVKQKLADFSNGLTNFQSEWQDENWPQHLNNYYDWIDSEGNIYPNLIQTFGLEICEFIVGSNETAFLDVMNNLPYSSWKNRLDENQFIVCNECNMDPATNCGTASIDPFVDLAFIPLILESTFLNAVNDLQIKYSNCVSNNSETLCQFAMDWWEESISGENSDLVNEFSDVEQIAFPGAPYSCEEIMPLYMETYIRGKVLAEVSEYNNIPEEDINSLISQINGEITECCSDPESSCCNTISKFQFKVDDYVEIYLCAYQCENDRFERYDEWVETFSKDLSKEVEQAFINGCLVNTDENFNVTYNNAESHFTLYFYDKENRLRKTVPPEGVDYVNSIAKEHKLETTYDYNSLNQLVRQETPDGGVTEYIYDRAGRIRFSKSSVQQSNEFSFTKYDANGRITANGDCSSSVTWEDLYSYADDPTFPQPNAYGQDVTISYYNQPQECCGEGEVNFLVENTSGRIAQTQSGDLSVFYSYDAHGRVKSVLNIHPELGGKWVSYEYSPVQGRMEKVNFMEGREEEDFYHRYEYDEMNRLVRTEISDNNKDWYNAAEYEYAIHGPLKKLKLADNLQELNYFYTSNGWLKAINKPLESWDAEHDQQDLFSEVIHYYQGDFGKLPFNSTNYERIGMNDIFSKTKDLFNGNISGITTNTAFSASPIGNVAGDLLFNAYEYDWGNRLVNSFSERQENETNLIFNTAGSGEDEYSVNLTYDGNGNITSLKRNKFDPSKFDPTAQTESVEMDDLSYFYKEVSGVRLNNQLERVEDAVSSIDPESNDFSSLPGQEFAYDAKGRLIQDDYAGINTIDWTSADKVKRIEKNNFYLNFEYTPSGNRFSKDVNGEEKLFYVYGADDNLLAVYRKADEEQTLHEIPLYGSDRVGVYHPETESEVIEVEVSSEFGLIDNGVLDVLDDVLNNVTTASDGVTTGITDLGETGVTEVGREILITDLGRHVNKEIAKELDILSVNIGTFDQLPVAEVQTEWKVKSKKLAENVLSNESIQEKLNKSLDGYLNPSPNTGLSKSLMLSTINKISALGVHFSDSLVMGMQIFQDIGDSVEVWDNLDLPAVQISNRISSYSQFVSSSYAEISIEENIVPTYINQMRAEALEQVLSGNLQRITHWGLNQDLEDNKTKAINTFSGELKAQVLKQSAEVDSHEWIKDPEKVADFFNGFNVQPIAPSVEKWLISTPNTGVGMAHELASTAQIIVATLGDADIDFEPEGGEGTDALNPKPILKPAKLNFELKDHLGNVRATFTPDNVYDSEVRSLSINSLTDYYPGGSIMPGRNFNANEYRFGFGGHEKDDEVKGNGNHLSFGDMGYDTRLVRRWNIDPLSEAMPGYSPYSYAANNPILFFDPDGLFPITVHVRSFAPFKSFGAGLWKGDNRGFSTSMDATSRIRQVTSYETETTAGTTTAHGGLSASKYGAFAYSEATVNGQPSINTTGNSISTHLAGNNDALFPPLSPGSLPPDGGPTWDIDVHTDLNFDVTQLDGGNQLLNITGRIGGDGFPSAEAFVNDANGNSVFLGVGAAQAGPNKGPFVTLAGDDNVKMFDVNINIITDKDGIFTGVQQGDNTFTLDAWNKQFENTSPTGND